MTWLKYKKILLFLVIIPLIFLGCAKDASDMIPHITGYWEIEKVVNANNDQKDYKINQVVDYLFVNDSLQGFRKKLNPNFSGGFETSNNKEPFKITIEDNTLIINYNTPYDQWQETIALASETQLILVNDLDTKYYYKRFEGINVKE